MLHCPLFVPVSSGTPLTFCSSLSVVNILSPSSLCLPAPPAKISSQLQTADDSEFFYWSRLEEVHSHGALSHGFRLRIGPFQRQTGNEKYDWVLQNWPCSISWDDAAITDGMSPKIKLDIFIMKMSVRPPDQGESPDNHTCGLRSALPGVTGEDHGGYGATCNTRIDGRTDGHTKVCLPTTPLAGACARRETADVSSPR